MTALAIGFVTSKAPHGGYCLSRITSLDGGTTQAEVVAYRSSLNETQAIEHQLKSEIFSEPAWYGHQQQYREPAPLMPASSVMPAPSNGQAMDDGTMPKFAEDFARNGGLTGRLQEEFNSVMRAAIPVLFLASVWAGAYLRPLLA